MASNCHALQGAELLNFLRLQCWNLNLGLMGCSYALNKHSAVFTWIEVCFSLDVKVLQTFAPCYI